ncbi:hypothetical protein HYT01_04305 [Candidatus Giovannonibacteria bacterium]|nr:hypothetical protein [Candidatus Giovannonibacteria bacterium]
MSTNTWITVIIVAAIIIVAGFFFYKMPATNNGGVTPAPTGSVIPSPTGNAEENSFLVSDQPPASTVAISRATVKDGGFAVIYDDSAGKAGKVLGTSALLKAGDNANVKITLSRKSTDGETLHVVLFKDNGDGKFQATTDTPVKDSSGADVSSTFTVNSSATLPTDANLY